MPIHINKIQPSAIRADFQKRQRSEVGVGPKGGIKGFYCNASGIPNEDIEEQIPDREYVGVELDLNDGKWNVISDGIIIAKRDDAKEAAETYDLFQLANKKNAENFPENLEKYQVFLSSGDGIWREVEGGCEIKTGWAVGAINGKGEWQITHNSEIIEHGKEDDIVVARVKMEHILGLCKGDEDLNLLQSFWFS